MTNQNDLHETDLDCFDIIESCELLTGVMLESQNPVEYRAACKCLNICLASLEIAFTRQLSAVRIAELTCDKPVEIINTHFHQQSEMLRQYCQALAGVLLNTPLPEQTNITLTGLLFELTDYMAEDLRAPRFARGQQLH
ncbi:hypothetical protein MUA04_10895 [Enterobacteriaceae bacterium H11S18]|uniref:hypothetical protein n=1 Tax=Dryocola clanedunensis TaxID=2925396 RepID=UPI0022EFE41F|nr:hypothetical protein [Dryocola clanedunensis]MCT4710693.1 hypothetical protein [Dryocola clanedunensis]